MCELRALLLEADWSPREDYKPTCKEEETRKTHMGSRVWRNPRLRLVEKPKPKPKGKQLLIKVRASGICGSDVHMYERDEKGYMLYPGLTRLPVVIGHEFSGVVEEVGGEVSMFKPGDPVTAEEMWWCGECLYCRAGMPNHCENLEEMGFSVDGSHTDYILVPEKYVWNISRILDYVKSEDKMYVLGATIEPVGVSYNAMFVRAGGFPPGSYVVIYGAGPIGLAAIALAKAAGASLTIVFDLVENRLKVAREMGADYAFNVKKLHEENIRPSDKVLELTGGYGADMQVEAAGSPSATLPEMERSLAVGGKIAWIGRADKTAPIFIERFQTRRAQIYGSQGHSGHMIFYNVIRLMASGKLDTSKMVTARFPLDKYEEAFNLLMKEKDQAKVQFKL
ncbi:alcohol dehydrogenase catalytic domain-containing protein [Candidatus Bathyarchaeota archaeon]|nr:alcohol dehydrogenase catalytic domain-containing protein [Candidatus Bathyarchaeota archaeon]MBS7618591.1 alcohol dehydrogenase catalytic domain-containing protein [Candidatus Bathyarchaeota archaeon]